MRKILLLMAIILPFVLTSCGDDKDEPKQSLEEQLIGSWVGDVYDLVDGKVIVTHPHSSYVIYNADHTGKSWMIIDGVILHELNFNWSLKGNILTNDKSPKQVEISIKDDVLYMKQETIELTIELEFHRAKG